MNDAIRALIRALDEARDETLRFVDGLEDAALCAQPDPTFSPIAWHLGHVAYTEAQWIHGVCGGDDALSRPHRERWAQDGCAKHERVHQPPRDALLAYLAEVREATHRHLGEMAFDDDDPLTRDGYIIWFITAHEHQHRETIALVRQLALEASTRSVPPPARAELDDPGEDFVVYPGGETELGTDSAFAYDNERARHRARVAPFTLARRPATVGAFAAFIEDGGYRTRALFSDAGWAFVNEHAVTHPHGWTSDRDGRLARFRLDGVVRALRADEPVVGISFHEAEAFARWRGARLMREVEFEHAARLPGAVEGACLGLTDAGPRAESDALFGNVWQWTDDWFEPYEGFAPFPYRGYSAPYFDGRHRVLRGGSFATSAFFATPTFRNWYQPEVRQIFSGLRCARDVE